ncbi:MAG: exclusion suppressor FxsA [Hoeflea sp. BRH_c9]|nr:MAG: exclusion suppressor FxsA [Hoeflea sp. BRH_c9]
MRFSLIPFLLLVVPLAEIAAFVVIGGQIGVWATLGMVLLTAILGSFLLRWQGVELFNRINAEMRANRVPGRELVHGVMILVAGVLLLTPGFVTDSFGFLLFVPAIRDVVWRLIKDRVVVQTMPAGFGSSPREPGSAPQDGVVDLSEDEFKRTSDPASPWSGDRNGLTKADKEGGGGANGL